MSKETATEAPVEVAASPRRKSRRGKVTAFPNWCKGCGLCVAFCPKHVLEQDESGHVRIVREEECTACRWCELHCPDFAIFVTELGEVQ